MAIPNGVRPVDGLQVEDAVGGGLVRLSWPAKTTRWGLWRDGRNLAVELPGAAVLTPQSAIVACTQGVATTLVLWVGEPWQATELLVTPKPAVADQHFGQPGEVVAIGADVTVHKVQPDGSLGPEITV